MSSTQGLREANGDMTAPAVFDDARMLPKRNGARTMIPGSWVGRTIEVDFVAGDGRASSMTATLLDWCPVGLIVHSPDTTRKTLLSFERLVTVALVED